MSSQSSNNAITNGSTNGKDYLLQKNRLYVQGFGIEQDFQDIRKFCIEHGKENVIYMTLFNTGGKGRAAFLTYPDEIVAEKAMNNLKLNHVMVNYARLKPNRVARMQSNGIQVNASPKPNAEKRHCTHFQSGSLARLVRTTDSDKIFVVMKSDMELYTQYLADVNEKASEMQPMDEMPRCETFVVAAYKEKYYRGVVIANVNGEPEFVDIFLVDIAKMVRTRYVELKKMPRDFRSSASFGPSVRFVHTFHLARLARLAQTWPKDSYITKCLQHFNGTEWEITPSDGSEFQPYATVELKNPNYIITSLNSMIKKLSEETYAIGSLVEKKASVGEHKTLVVIDDSNLKNDNDNMITFVERQYLESFVSTQDLVQRCGHIVDSLPAYAPKQNDLCIVKIESLWYRGIFNDDNETHPDEAWVQLIDNSILVSVKKQNIRPINGTCVQREIVTFVGKLAGFGDKIESSDIDDLCRRFKSETTIKVKAVKDVGDVAFAIEI